MASEPTWEPILDGTLADDARHAVLDVARGIANGEGEPLPPVDAALFWAYAAGALDHDWVHAKYDEATAALCAEAARGGSGVSLFYGASGIGFALAHISEPGTAEDELAQIDEAVAASLAPAKWTLDYDLIVGLAGIGVYLLERVATGDVPRARTTLDRLLDHALANSELHAEGVAWHTAAELLPPHQRERWPSGYFNCGLAHGMPGMIALLARAAELHDADPRYRKIASDALRWLEARALPDGGHGRYPSCVGRDPHEREPARGAWCYGDPGVAIAWYGAAKRLDVPCDGAIELARGFMAKSPAQCGVVDAGFCHGAAGLAHILNRFFQATGDATFRDAARTWFKHALDLRRPEGVGGFAAWWPGDGGRWRPSTSILEGAAGVALALLAALQPVEPAWDRFLMCDAP